MNEHVKNIVTAGTALIPMVGGSISVLIDKYVPSELEKRRNRLIEQFDQDIEKIKEKIKPQTLESEEYITVLFKVFKNAIEEHKQEKIRLFRAILQNSAINNNIQNPEIELYIKLVNELTLTHIRLLDHINKEGLYENTPYNVNGTEDFALTEFCRTDLKRLQLVEVNGLMLHTTNLGKRFYDYIQLAENE